LFLSHGKWDYMLLVVGVVIAIQVFLVFIYFLFFIIYNFFNNKFCVFLLVLMLNVFLLLFSAHHIFAHVIHCFSCFRYYLVLCCSCLVFIVLLLIPKVHYVLVKHSLCSYFCLMFIMLLLCVVAPTLCSLCYFVAYCS
jgi:hypothetical protein